MTRLGVWPRRAEKKQKRLYRLAGTGAPSRWVRVLYGLARVSERCEMSYKRGEFGERAGGCWALDAAERSLEQTPKGSFVRRSVAFCEPDAESRDESWSVHLPISMRMREQRGRVVESGASVVRCLLIALLKRPDLTRLDLPCPDLPNLPRRSNDLPTAGSTTSMSPPGPHRTRKMSSFVPWWLPQPLSYRAPKTEQHCSLFPVFGAGAASLSNLLPAAA